MLGGDLRHNVRKCYYRGQSNDGPPIQVEYRAHVKVYPPELICKIVRIRIFRNFRHHAGENEKVAEHRIM